MINKGLFTSLREDWKTPKKFYEELNKEFNFNFDPCPSNPKFNGLEIEWKERNFVNPPYGREIGSWIEKGFKEAQKGKLVVFLIPSRTDTKYWHDYIMKANEIRFIKGRLCFDDTGKPAPFPSAIVVFNASPPVQTSNSTSLTSAKQKGFNMGDKVSASPTPKEAMLPSHHPNIKSNLNGGLPAGCNSTEVLQ